MSEDAPQIESDPISIGSTLQKARKAAMFSLDHVASQTHLPKEVIESLENEQFDKLPDAVFVRGYIRAYAKLLGVDSQPLIDSYNATQFEEPEIVPTASLANSKPRTPGMDRMTIWSTVAVALILLGLVASWWWYRDVDSPVRLAELTNIDADKVDADIDALSSELSVKELENNTSADAKPDHQVGLGTLSEDNESKPVVETKEQENINTTVVDSQSDRATNQIIAARVEPVEPQVLTDGRVVLNIKFNEESWIEIFDARKRRLLHGLIKPGASREVSGLPPFNVFFGNAPGVELHINGELFDHKRYARRNNTARFSIEDADIPGT